MFRTRDFVLYFSVAAFLLVAIGLTVATRLFHNGGTFETSEFVETSDVPYTAEVYEPNTISREERVLAMKQKIAAGEGLVASALSSSQAEVTQAEPPSATSDPEESNDVTAENVSERKVDQCPDHAPYGGAWSPVGLTIEVVEGARLVYREDDGPTPMAPYGTTSQPVTSRIVLLQLPIRLGPAAVPSCLPSDVIGVAKDGSLIRNDEIGLYGVFDESTLIGYALDGFPIYGTTAQATDVCGGRLVAGQYRYQLAVDREAVLNCFAAPPVVLP